MANESFSTTSTVIMTIAAQFNAQFLPQSHFQRVYSVKVEIAWVLWLTSFTSDAMLLRSARCTSTAVTFDTVRGSVFSPD